VDLVQKIKRKHKLSKTAKRDRMVLLVLIVVAAGIAALYFYITYLPQYNPWLAWEKNRKAMEKERIVKKLTAGAPAGDQKTSPELVDKLTAH
jgi:hypothetical protein